MLERLPHMLSKKGTKGKKVKKRVDNALLFDTSAIIDGRILDVAKQGFLAGTIIVPEFILLELKRIADSSDTLKRARGRQGLEVLNNLKKIKGIKVNVTDDEVEAPDIDEKLVRVAKLYKGKLVTCDFNLNRKATVGGLKVLNVNDLANALKTRVLPGEQLVIKIVQEGKEKEQGVGYLLDGTMIVIEKGREYVGRTVDVVVSRIFQTAAGRMIFTKLKTE